MKHYLKEIYLVLLFVAIAIFIIMIASSSAQYQKDPYTSIGTISTEAAKKTD